MIVIEDIRYGQKSSNQREIEYGFFDNIDVVTHVLIIEQSGQMAENMTKMLGY